MKKNINALWVLVLLFVCPMAPSSAAAPDQTGTIQFAGKPIQVSIGEIGKDDKGNTTVQLFTDFEASVRGFNADAVLRAVLQEIRVKIVAQNKTFETSGFSIGGGNVNMTAAANGMVTAKIEQPTYHFDTAASPEKIMVYNEQDSGLTFSGETKEIIK
jgi:hypothetical protein